MFHELLGGDATLKNVILVANAWSEVSRDIDEVFEDSFTNTFKPALDKGAQMACHHNTAQSAHNIIRKIMRNHPVVMSQNQRELADEHEDFIDTVARSEAINLGLDEQIGSNQAELKIPGEEMVQISEKEKARQEAEEEIRKVQERIDMIRWGSRVSSPDPSRRLLELKMEIHPTEAIYRRLFIDLNRRLQGAANGPPDELARLEREKKRLQDQLDGFDDSCRCQCVVM